MAAQEERQHMTVEEWRALLAQSECKYEYIDGWVYAMAGGSLAHAGIAVNALVALDATLGDGTCRVYNSDAAVRLSAHRYVFPDVTVTCEPQDRPTTEYDEITRPRVVIEVLSETTERYDRGKKFRYYQACPSLHEYVLIATEYQAVEVFRRTDEGWRGYRVYGPDEAVELASIGVRVPVAALYRRTEVPRAIPDTQEVPAES